MERVIKSELVEVTVGDVGGKMLSIKDKNGREYLWSGDPAYWDDRAPNLFPFCGRCMDSQYSYEGKSYPMSIHGFLPNTKMDIVECSSNSVLLRLVANEQTKSIYPFDFTLDIGYKVVKNRIDVSYRVAAGHDGLYFSLGAHPGFVLGDGDYRIDFASPCEPVSLEITERGYLGSARSRCPIDSVGGITITDELLGECGLFLQGVTPDLTLSADGSDSHIRIRFDDFTTLGIWRPHGAPFVCIEPWNGLPADDGRPTELTGKSGILKLAVGGQVEMGFSIEIE